METSKTPQIKIKKKLPKWVRAVIILLIIAAIAAGGFAAYKKHKSPTTAKSQNTFTVQKGDISVEISGSGSVEPIDRYEVTALVKGEILSSPFEEGDIVNKDALLYKIDTADVENNIRRAENSLVKAKMSYQEALEALNDLTTYSKITGVITEMYVEKGDSISKGSKIMDVKDTNTMILEIPFLAHEASGITAGTAATVMLDNSFYTLDGRVQHVSAGSEVSAEGVEVCIVEIAVTNPGAVKEGDIATAMIGDIACNSSGTFRCNKNLTITSDAGGEIINLPYKKGDIIYAGAEVLKIDDREAQKALTNAKISLSDAELSLQNTQEQLNDYNITSPISGTVIQKNSKAGDSIDSGASKTVMAIIADMSKIVFEISVDELDISKVKVGQKVDITADALKDRKFEGVVDYISVVGTTQNGVTSYPVKIEILNPEGLIPGMNVTANIVVDFRQDVLVVPLSAVKRGNMVTVKKSDTSPKAPQSAPAKGDFGGKAPEGMPQKQQSEGVKMPGVNVPDGFENIKVTVGLNDSDYIEILSGLSEGDVVIIPETISNSTMNGMFPVGSMGGGMPRGPMGGMPGGGMR